MRARGVEAVEAGTRGQLKLTLSAVPVVAVAGAGTFWIWARTAVAMVIGVVVGARCLDGVGGGGQSEGGCGCGGQMYCGCCERWRTYFLFSMMFFPPRVQWSSFRRKKTDVALQPASQFAPPLFRIFSKRSKVHHPPITKSIPHLHFQQRSTHPTQRQQQSTPLLFHPSQARPKWLLSCSTPTSVFASRALFPKIAPHSSPTA